MDKRQSGILLHITALPSKYGIGDMGSFAYAFVDFAASGKGDAAISRCQSNPQNQHGYDQSNRRD